MELLTQFISYFLHLDVHLTELVNSYGSWTYVILFLIVFCETGLVVTPFLPGDSLLFAAGALASRHDLGTTLDVNSMALILFIAAVFGDAVNYSIGNFLGEKVFENPNSRIFKQAYLKKTQSFYEKYGGKTIIIARFVPIVRTFAPFLAGVGEMNYKKFASYNVIGAALWVVFFVYGGFMFGGHPIVKKNFSLVILAIIIISVLPAVVEIWRERRNSKKIAS